MNDLKFALRQLLKNPGFTAVAVLTLALGIGANTTIFTLVNAILLRPLPFEDSEKLVAVFENYAPHGSHKTMVGPPAFIEWRKQVAAFEGLAARDFHGYVLTGRGEAEGLSSGVLSANIFSLLKVRPVLGRDFLPEEETYGKHHVVLLSHELWERRFGSDPGIVGQNITLSDEPYTVIGVMPPKIFFPDRDVQLWTPLAFNPDEAKNRHAHNYLVYGRLKPNVSLEQAQAEVELIARRMAEQDEQSKGWGAELYPLHDIAVGDSKTALLVLLGSVGAVLMIACANIANLLLARSASRSREFAIRAAIGATRGHMLRQLLTESLLLALIGGAAGILLTWVALPAIVHFLPPDLPRIWEGIRIDARTLAFTLLITLVTGLLFGLVPALQCSRSFAGELSDGSRGTSSGRRRQSLRRGLVVAEMAMSLLLLIGAGLMIRSFGHLLSQQLGYNPDQLVTIEVGLTDKKYSEPAAIVRFFEEFLAKVRQTPGMNSAALVAGLPLAQWNANVGVNVDGAPARAPEESTAAQYAQISPGYLQTMAIPLLQGRDFESRDRDSSLPVVIVNQTFAQEFGLGREKIIGRHLTLSDGAQHAEIVGVIPDIKRNDLAGLPRAEVYRPFSQACWGQMRLIVRTPENQANAARLARGILDTIDRDIPILNVRTMTDFLSSSVAQRRFSVHLLTAFAGIALLLASIGLYGVIAYHVTQRTQEIGIRMALGAQKGSVMRLILREGLTLALAGIGVGLVSAIALTRVIRGMLYEISPTDPLTYICLALLLGLVAGLACWIPARRAMRIDPMEALRNE